MKPNSAHISIKWKLLGFLAVFVAVLILMLWLFQVVFLESIYEAIQTRTVKVTAESIARRIDSDELPAQLLKLYEQNRISCRVVTAEGQDVACVVGMESTIKDLLPVQLMLIYATAARDGGATLEVLDAEELQSSIYQPLFGGRRERNVRTIIYGKLVTSSDGGKLMILLNSTITPVNATVDTLRAELVVITIVMTVLSLALAFFMSGVISRPIIKINASAKILAKGDYSVRFDEGGYREITELSQTLNNTAEQLGKVDQMRRDFIANVSHDLRTPLTLITGYGEVMRDLPGENTPENVQNIIDEAKRLTSLVNDLLDLSRLQSGKQKVEMQDFSLTGLVDGILSRYAQLVLHEGYRLSWEHEGDAVVHGDTTRMTQVVYNLINNAITYTGEDKTVTVRQTVSDGRVRIDVIDTGEGIAKEDLPLIWERYYKVDKTHRRAAVGSGLGLSIVRNVLELHGAQYGVQSEPGKGSDFWFEMKTVPSARA